MTDLHQAIERADIGQVWKLIQDGARLDDVDPSFELTPLALAAESGSTEIVRILLAAGADPDQGGLTTPLEAAVVGGHVEVARALLKASVDVNHAVDEGFTPLMTAAVTGNAPLVRLLLDAGARPRAANDAGDTAVSLAESEGHDTIVKLLKTKRRRKPPATRRSPTPAARPPKRTSAVPPRRRAPDPTASSHPTSGATSPPPADIPEPTPHFGKAAGRQLSDGAAELFGLVSPTPEAEAPHAAPAGVEMWDAGAPIEEGPAKAPNPETPDRALDTEAPGTRRDLDTGKLRALLDLASYDGIQGLLDAGTLDVDGRDSKGLTPLMIAAAHGDPEAVRLLIDAGACLETTGHPPAGWSALIHAVRSPSRKRVDVISMLVAAGADVNQACGDNQRTPLMHAAAADVHRDADSPLSFAVATKSLISLGADLEARDRRGHTVWRQTKRNALAERTSSPYRRRLHQLLRVLEHCGATPATPHRV